MKKEYNSVEIEIIVLNDKDVIITSTEREFGGDADKSAGWTEF